MKKLAVILMISLLSLSFVSCEQGKAPESDDNNQVKQVESKSEENPVSDDKKVSDDEKKPEDNKSQEVKTSDNEKKVENKVENKSESPKKSDSPKKSENLRKSENSKKTEPKKETVAENSDKKDDVKPDENKAQTEVVKDEDKIPEFSFLDLDGKEHNIRDFEGKIVVVNFWYTGCSWCKKEMPAFDALAASDSDVKVIPISVGDSVEAINKYKQKNNLSLTMYMDKDMQVAQSFGITGFPTTLFIDSDGRFVGGAPGYLPEDKLNEILSKIKDKSIYNNDK